MITHRFHDTVFCLKNGTPMITYPLNDTYMTSYGDSKYFNLLNDFGLAKTNYINKRNDITQEAIMGKYLDAINAFVINKLNIETILDKNKKKYVEYLTSAKNMILNM
jgi:hypothetical protein